MSTNPDCFCFFCPLCTVCFGPCRSCEQPQRPLARLQTFGLSPGRVRRVRPYWYVLARFWLQNFRSCSLKNIEPPAHRVTKAQTELNKFAKNSQCPLEWKVGRKSIKKVEKSKKRGKNRIEPKSHNLHQ